MLNTRSLTLPTPADINLRLTGDPLGMLREGSFDQTRYNFYNNIPARLSNRTNDIFNHYQSVGGYNGDGWNYRGKITALNVGGISTLAPPPPKQYAGNQVTNNPIPFVNALIYAPVHPEINALVDKPLPPNINPIAVP